MDISDLSRIKGPLKYVGYAGVLIMMGGLAVFALGLLSTFMDASNGEIPKGFPRYAIYGFGVAVVGGVLATIALAMGKKESEFNIQPGAIHIGDIIHGDVYRDVNGNIIINPSGPVDARYYNQQVTYVGQIDRAVRSLPLPPSTRHTADAAVEEVAQAVATQDRHATANALVRLTSILNEAGALASSGDAASRAIVGLAQTLGGYAQSLISWFSAF